MAATTSDAGLDRAEAGESSWLGESVRQQAPVNHDDRGSHLFTMLGFVFLTFNSAMAIFRANSDLWTISFVAFAYVDLILLFYSPSRSKVKAAVWILTTLLTLLFSYKVATVMPPPMAAIILAMTAAALLGIFYGFCPRRGRHQLA